MVQLNLALREINCKVVYFGCGLGGKTTNLEIVHEKASPDSRGDLTSIATESDRTLFFDFMPLDLGTVSGMRVKFQLYTVPGQVYYNSTRKLVLRGADGVIFVADSQRSKLEENIESLENLEENLQEQGRSLEEMPHVIQFNKRDLDDVCTVEEMSEALNRYGAPVFEAVAAQGDGVLDTFKALAGMLLEKVRNMSTESKAKPASQAKASSEERRGKTTGARPKVDVLRGGLSGSRETPAPERRIENINLTREETAKSPITSEPPAEPVAAKIEPVAPRAEPTPAPLSASEMEPASVPAAVAAPARHVQPSIRKPAVRIRDREERITSGSIPLPNGMMVSTSSRRRRRSGGAGRWIGIGLALMAAGGAAAAYWLGLI